MQDKNPQPKPTTSSKATRAVCAERVRERIKAGDRLSDAMQAWTGSTERLQMMDSIRDVLGSSIVHWEQRERTIRQNLAVFEAALAIDRVAANAETTRRMNKRSMDVRDLGIPMSAYLQTWGRS